jgi:hypothetical protein
VILLEKSFFVQAFQLALFSDSYPNVDPTPTDNWYFWGENGVAVSTQDNQVEVRVVKGPEERMEEKGLIHLAKKRISIGPNGLTVGNVLTADLKHIPYPSGIATIDLYVDSLEVGRAKRVLFVID